jgi:hypothetical protein
MCMGMPVDTRMSESEFQYDIDMSLLTFHFQ